MDKRTKLHAIYGSITAILAFIAMVLIAVAVSSYLDHYSVYQAGWAFVFLTIFTMIAWIWHSQVGFKIFKKKKEPATVH